MSCYYMLMLTDMVSDALLSSEELEEIQDDTEAATRFCIPVTFQKMSMHTIISIIGAILNG